MEQMVEEDSRSLKKLNESQVEKAAKKKKLDEEVEELKRHLQIVPNEEDDVYTEVTPLARKVPIVDHEIYNENNKPDYKIKKADGTHQLYLSFLSLFRNVDSEDLEALWSLVKERFATAKPKNFSSDFLLITLGAMFEKLDIHMIDNVRLEVEDESEVSLELLRTIFQLPQANDNNHDRFMPAPLFYDMDPFYKNELGFTKELKTSSCFKTTGLLQPWKTLCKIFSKCLATRVTRWDQPSLQIMQVMYCFVNNIHVDYVELLWEGIHYSLHH
nr:hypothetical protein [Tanacetum cinerariifolium]